MYWNYWKRGWWSWLMQVCVNCACIVLFLPLALLFRGGPLYYILAAILAVFIIAPLSGWLFEVFVRNSERLVPDTDQSSAEKEP